MAETHDTDIVRLPDCLVDEITATLNLCSDMVHGVRLLCDLDEAMVAAAECKPVTITIKLPRHDHPIDLPIDVAEHALLAAIGLVRAAERRLLASAPPQD